MNIRLTNKIAGVLGAGVLLATTPSEIKAEDSLIGGVSGSVAMGYDTEYYFRGVNFGGSPIWTGVDISIPLAEGYSLNPGIWYINPTDGASDDELDYYVSLDTPFGIGLVYTAYTFPEAGGDTNEFGITYGYTLAGIDFGLGYYYDIDLEASYYEISTGYAIDVTDGIALEGSATLGFLDEELNHVLLTLGLPIALTDSATLTPYVAGTFALDAIEDGDDEVFGGVSLAVAF